MAGGWGSSKNGVRLGCFWDSIEKNADGSQARITNARIRIDRDVNIVDSSNSLSWSGGAVNDGSASNINCDGSGEKTIKTVTGQWQDLVYGATKSANFSASMSGINYAGATISNTESVTYPARAYLAPVAPTNITWTQNSPGNFTISWSNMNSTAAPWTTLVLLRTELGGATTELVLGNPSTDVANVQSGLALDKQYSWALRISNSTATVVSASTSVTPIPLHTMSLSANTVDIGSSITFNINKYGSSNTSTIYFIKNGVKTIVWDRQTATSYTYTFDKASWSIYLSNAVSGSFTVGIETFSGTLSLGVNTYTVTVNVPNVSPYLPTSVIPVRTEQNSNIASAFGANVFIKNLSKIRHTWLGSPGDSASVTMREILIRESWRSTMLLMPEVSGTPGYVYDEIPAGNGTVTVSSRTTDSRGRVATSDESTFNVYNYAAPVINTFTVARCDSAGNINNSGTYVKFTINVSVSSVNPGSEANKMKYRIRLLDSNGNETGTDLYTKTLDSTLIHNITTGAIGGSYSSQSGYSFKLTLDDNLTILTGSSITRSASISSEVYPLSIGTNGIAIGKVYDDSSLALDVVGETVGVIPVGVYVPYVGAVAPIGWLLCNGSTFSAAMYPKLAAMVGTTYGGTTTNPALPDLRRRIPVGLDISAAPNDQFNYLGKMGGESNHILSIDEMPSHTHVQNSHTHIQDAHTHIQDSHNHSSLASRIYSAGPNNTISNGSGRPWGSDQPTGYATATNQYTTANNQYTVATNQYTGGNQGHNNLQPYIVANYIIKAR